MTDQVETAHAMTAAAEDVFPLGGTLGGLNINFMFASRGHLDFYAEQVRREGLASYEAPTPALIAHLAQTETEGAPSAILDVGAHTGLLTLLAAAANPRAQIHAFEPLPNIRDTLQGNLRLNPHLAARVSVHPIALSDKDGEVTFYETVNDMGFLSSSSSLELTHVKSIDHGVYREQRLQAQRLDAWAAQHLGKARIILVKIDVESHENAVLLGGMETLALHRPVLVVEVLPHAAIDAHNRLLTQGYVDFAIGTESLIQLAAVRYFHGAANHLLCPVERLPEIFGLCRRLGLRLELG